MNIKKYIPSFFTSLNLGFGFLAILFVNHGDIGLNLYRSSILLLFCVLFDTLDGYLARKLNASSELGKELDSLADLVSFGVAPAFIYYNIAPGNSAWYMLPSAIVVIASGLRLAKFNLLPSYDYFQGLPTPANAFFLIGLFLGLHYENELIEKCLANDIVYFILPVIFSILMLSSLRMFSFKGLEKPIIKNRYQILLVACFIALLLIDNKLAIPLTIIIFILLSILQSSRRKL